MTSIISTTTFYRTYRNMIDRCINPKNKVYRYYGGRGIKVCERWMKYENFEDDMYDEYGYELEIGTYIRKYVTLDRIDVDGDYSPENCRWTTSKVQNNNKRQKNKAH